MIALGRAHDLLMQVSWASASLLDTVRGATEPYDGKGAGRFSIDGPDIGITSGAVIALAMTFNELCTNTTKFGALSSARRAHRNYVDNRRRNPTAATDMDRKRRPGGQRANPEKFRHPHDGVAWTPVEWPSSAQLSGSWILLFT